MLLLESRSEENEMGILGFHGTRRSEYSIGIAPDSATRKILGQQQRDTLGLFMKLLLDSGRYKEEPATKLVNRNAKTVFKAITSGKLLELGEKKRLGISARRKYGTDYIETLTEKGLENDASVGFFMVSYYRASGIVGRQYKIAEYKRAGVKRVRISPCNDGRDCRAIAKYADEAFAIDELPTLPLAECDAEYCRCWISPVVE
jgi:hypothetical protein